MPGARLSNIKPDLRQALLVPGLEIGSRLDLNADTLHRFEVKRRPFTSDIVCRNLTCLGDDEFRNSPPCRVAQNVGHGPTPKIKKREAQRRSLGTERLTSGAAL